MGDEWLKKLKVGDTVIVTYSGFGRGYKFAKVDKISEKKRDITVENKKYRANGSDYSSGYHHYYLLEPTEENKQKVADFTTEVEFSLALSRLHTKRGDLSIYEKREILRLLKEILGTFEDKETETEPNATSNSTP